MPLESTTATPEVGSADAGIDAPARAVLRAPVTRRPWRSAGDTNQRHHRSDESRCAAPNRFDLALR